jgi:tRNA dimethylallyltransferase
MDLDGRPPVLVITGPTASGKSAAALSLAEKCSGEIISADSMQVYRGMDIGTAKTPPHERRGIPHHMLDIRDPGERFSVADFAMLAAEAVRSIYSRGHRPIVCGGTGQYISALLEGIIFPDAPSDPVLRKQLNEQAAEQGLSALYSHLAAVDPATAARISSNDQKRIVRALELYQQTGKTLTEHNQDSRRGQPAFRFQSFCLSHDRPVLYERINQRVLDMVGGGLEEEVRRLLALSLPAGSTCLQAIGYKEMIPCLQGLASRQETIGLIQQATRRYAKRQLTWFRGIGSLHWLNDLAPNESVKIILENQ